MEKQKQVIIDDGCFVVPPLAGHGEETALSGKPFISGLTPAPALGKLFDVDGPPKDENGDDIREGAD